MVDVDLLQNIVVIGLVLILVILLVMVGRNKSPYSSDPIKSYPMKSRRDKINEQVEHMKMANQPGYRPPDDDMEAYYVDGVTRYRKKRRV